MSSFDPLVLLAGDRDLITYRKKLNQITGGVLSTLLLQQMIYWASKNDYKPFYKFSNVCNHEKYAPGDSWREELGFTRYEFETALKKIGTKSVKGTDKSALYEVEKVTHLVIYWTDKSRVTWWHLNAPLLRKLVEIVYLGNVGIQHYLGNVGKQHYLGNAGFRNYLVMGESNITFTTETNSQTNTETITGSDNENYVKSQSGAVKEISKIESNPNMDSVSRVNLTPDGDEIEPEYDPSNLFFIGIMANLRGSRRGLQSKRRKAWIGLLKKCQQYPRFSEWMIWQSEHNSNQEPFDRFVGNCNNMDMFELWLAGELKPIDKLAELGVKKGRGTKRTKKAQIVLNEAADESLRVFCDATGFEKPDNQVVLVQWVSQIKAHADKFGEDKLPELYKRAYATLRDAFVNGKIQLTGPKSFTKTMGVEAQRLRAGTPANDTPAFSDVKAQAAKLRGE